MHKRNKHISELHPLALVIGGLLVCPLGARADGTFTGLGTLGGPYIAAVGVSADGGTVVGNGLMTERATMHAFRWAGGTIQDLGTLGGTQSLSTGVSSNGSVVVGTGSITGDTETHAFRWSSGTMRDLGTLGGSSSSAAAVSADGSVVVGGSSTTGNTGYHAFRWAGGSMQDLGTLGGQGGTSAAAVSADGSVVVGTSGGGAPQHAFRWAGGAMNDLGTLGGSVSWAYGVSADGSVVVGDSYTAANTGATIHAYRWATGTMQDLGTLGGTSSFVAAVSTDGNVVVGTSTTSDPTTAHAFRWAAGTMQDLGTLGGAGSSARAVSADGRVVVGSIYTSSTIANRAFRWTQAAGMQDVATWLSGAAVAVPNGWKLTDAVGVSADGNVVVGDGTDPAGNLQGWLARVGAAGSGLITDVSAFNSGLIEAGARAAQSGSGLADLALFGAHHRSLLDSGLVRSSDSVCAWATADSARYDSAGNRTEIVEAGGCKDIGSARVGVGIGQAWAQQDWGLGGGAKFDGQYLIAEADNVFANALEGSVTGYYGRFDTSLRRHYVNGATVDSSNGHPNAGVTAIRLRLDWRDAVKLGQFGFSPYAAYAWSETRLDAYTETDGGFPARFASSKWATDDLRIGAYAKTALSGSTDLSLAVEAVHRLNDSTDGVNGQVIGLWSFALPGQSVKQSWARAIADVDYRVSNTTALTFGGSVASSGGDASWSLTAGLRATF